ncbi:MAG: hypothetical protein ACEPO8_13140 [Rhodothermaceae bacterium]
MDSISLTIIITGLFSLLIIFQKKQKYESGLKDIVWELPLFLTGILFFYWLLNNVNVIKFYSVRYELFINIIFSVCFLSAGIFSYLQKPFKEKKAISFIKKLISFFKFSSLLLLVFIFSLSSYYLFPAMEFIWAMLLLSVIFSAAKFISCRNFETGRSFFSYEFSGIILITAAFYQFTKMLFPDNQTSNFKLFSPSDTGFETASLIIVGVVFILIFLAGFFTKPNKGN